MLAISPRENGVPFLVGDCLSLPVPNLYHIPRFVGLVDREGVGNVPHHENRHCDKDADGDSAEHEAPKESLLGCQSFSIFHC